MAKDTGNRMVWEENMKAVLNGGYFLVPIEVLDKIVPLRFNGNYSKPRFIKVEERIVVEIVPDRFVVEKEEDFNVPEK